MNILYLDFDWKRYLEAEGISEDQAKRTAKYITHFKEFWFSSGWGEKEVLHLNNWIIRRYWWHLKIHGCQRATRQFLIDELSVCLQTLPETKDALPDPTTPRTWWQRHTRYGRERLAWQQEAPSMLRSWTPAPRQLTTSWWE